MINAGGYRMTSEEVEELRDLADDAEAESEIDWSDPKYDPDYR